VAVLLKVGDRAVLDASVLVQCVVREAHTEKAVEIISMLEDIYVPPLLFYEVGNVLVTLARRNMFEKDDAVRKLRLLSAIPTLRVRDVSLTDSVELALRLGITLYDAVYVWLSTAENVGFITADRDLCNKARDVARVVHISEL
jgi:predicted nucleic acid-binding protein